MPRGAPQVDVEEFRIHSRPDIRLDAGTEPEAAGGNRTVATLLTVAALAGGVAVLYDIARSLL